MSDSLWPHRLQPARLLHPWDFLGKNTGVGCHFLHIYIYTYTYISPHFGISFPFRSPQCIEFSVPYSRFSLIDFIHSINTVHVSNPVSQFKWVITSYWSEWPSSKKSTNNKHYRGCREKGSLIHSWRRDWQPTPVLLPGEFHGQRSLADYSPWGHKESNTTEWLTLEYVQFKACPF